MTEKNPIQIQTPTQVTPSSTQRPGCLAYFLFAAASAWVIAVTLSIHTVAWLTDQVLIVTGIYLPWFAWLLISWAHAALLALFVVPLAILVRTPRFRAAYQTWALSVAFAALMALARVFSASQLQAASLAFFVLSLIGSIALVAFARSRGRQIGAAPMIAYGAFGSALDTVFTLLAGLGLGLFAGILLSVFLFQPLAADESKPSMLFGGFAASIALAILAASFGAPGAQLLLLAVLPPLGFLIAAIARVAGAARAALPIAALVGLVAAAPLMFFDPVELALVLGLGSSGEALAWAMRAAGLSLLIGLLIGLAAMLVFRRPRALPRAFAIGGVAAAWLAAIVIYIFAGRPGFFGEQLFVILKDQADVSAAKSIANRDERLRYVYSTLTKHADATQANLRATLDRIGVKYQPYYLVNAMEVNAEPLLRVYFTAQPEVDRVLDNPRLRPLPAPQPVSRGDLSAPTEPPWNIKAIGADRVWSDFGVTGKGIVVGQSDSGVDGAHPALAPGYRGRNSGDDYNWLDPWYATRAPTDIGGHGTHTLGTILGRGGIGVAPGAEWFGCVNLARNLGNPALYLDCMQFMLAPYPQRGDALHDGDPTRAAHVLNDSWGCPQIEGCDANVFLPAVRALRAAGIFVVVSAGNNGPRCASLIEPLALYDSVFTVGAIDRQGVLSFFSSRGPVTVDGSNRIKPDIVAPGEQVVSSFPGNTYASEEGTSMAGPHIVGTVALMWSANPKLIGDIDQTQKILIDTAKPYAGTRDACSDGKTPNDATGYGIVDAYAAVKAALAAK
ncbi:MAG: S8 family serine peptidase [Chloroflexota bacterium]|nr:S8 family serine peptidase [Chloroflexota bacterium]